MVGQKNQPDLAPPFFMSSRHLESFPSGNARDLPVHREEISCGNLNILSATLALCLILPIAKIIYIKNKSGDCRP
jgi:hypothetical protein